LIGRKIISPLISLCYFKKENELDHRAPDMTKKQELVNFYDLISNDEEKQKIAAAMRADTHLDAFLVVVERKKNSPRMLYLFCT
jgi:hypothetical protein